MPLFCRAGVFWLWTAGFLAAASASESPGVAAQGYTYSLFDGKTLTGWTVENDCAVEVRDGQLLLKDGNGWLRSDHAYSDFVLHVEWKALKEHDYDAGVYLRAGREGAPFPKQGYQANLLEGKEGNIGNVPGAASTGLIKPGEWNAFDITAVGETVAMVINGRKAYEVEGLKVPAGYVGLQVEVPKGGQFLVRNLRITELGYRSLFNGTDLAGWEGAGQPADRCWKVEEGALICTGESGPWLRSAEQYSDFNFRFEYQVGEGGNSGIYVRVPENGNHHRDNDEQPPAGFEVQLLDDSAPKHANLKDYQYGGSVYDIAGATQRVGKKPGEWNTMEINCRGHNVTVAHNGIVVVQVTPEEFPLIKLRQQKGFLGLQNHRTVVKFRNLRIGPATE